MPTTAGRPRRSDCESAAAQRACLTASMSSAGVHSLPLRIVDSVPSGSMTAVRRLCVTPPDSVPSRKTDTPNRARTRRSPRRRRWRNATPADPHPHAWRARRAPAGVSNCRIEADRQQRDPVAQRADPSGSRAAAARSSVHSGQKSGSGQRVYMNVTASTRPRQSDSDRGAPVSSVEFRRPAPLRRLRGRPWSWPAVRSASGRARSGRLS